MMDRLTVISAESDPALTEYFRRAELRRSFCNDKAAQVVVRRSGRRFAVRRRDH
jgi:hypothetical protein